MDPDRFYARAYWISYAGNPRQLCTKPYPGHRKGCPNFGKRPTCPPGAPLLWQTLDTQRAVFAIWNRFDLAAHVARMLVKHPTWSERQLRNCLYWQGTARKQLREKIDRFLVERPRQRVILCPEACGVNVHETMAALGVHLDWPPTRCAYQVALAGTPREAAD